MKGIIRTLKLVMVLILLLAVATVKPSSPPRRISVQKISNLSKLLEKAAFPKFFKVTIAFNKNNISTVRLKATGQLYAMKTLSKAKIKRDNKVDNIINERKILERVKSSHPFIIQMASAFKNVC